MSPWVGISSSGVGSCALDVEDINGRRACGARANGLSARLKHHVVSQRRRVEVDKFALRSTSIDDIAVGIGSHFAEILADAVDIPCELRARATQGDVVIRHNAAIASVDPEPARKIVPHGGVAAYPAFVRAAANVDGGYATARGNEAVLDHRIVGNQAI